MQDLSIVLASLPRRGSLALTAAVTSGCARPGVASEADDLLLLQLRLPVDLAPWPPRTIDAPGTPLCVLWHIIRQASRQRPFCSP